MPETRYIETYDYSDLPPEERTPNKAKITRTANEVSDEELAEERRIKRMANILGEIDVLKTEIEKLKAMLGKK